jgi:hypothetical protein
MQGEGRVDLELVNTPDAGVSYDFSAGNIRVSHNADAAQLGRAWRTRVAD